MHDKGNHHVVRKTSTRSHQLCRWATSRRRIALGLLLRGLCYGVGTGAMSLATFWLQHRM